MTRATFQMPVACDVILWVVTHRPGITEADLAEALYGERNQPRVHQDCDLLESRSLIRRDRDAKPMRLYPEKSGIMAQTPQGGGDDPPGSVFESRVPSG